MSNVKNKILDIGLVNYLWSAIVGMERKGKSMLTYQTNLSLYGAQWRLSI
jgi:hypothetical protein